VAIETVPYNTSWRDAKGWIGRVRHFITGDTASGTYLSDFGTVRGALESALAGLTNAAFAGDNGLGFATRPTLAYGANSEYPAEWMKAVFTFTTDASTVSRFKIPAPKLVIFDSDGVTVLNDGTQALVVAYVAAVKTAVNTVFVSSEPGLPYTHFVGGLLRLGRQPRRFNEFIKSSHLVQGEGE